MSKAKTKTKPGAEPGVVMICRNRKATHDYEIQDTIECGVVLVGTEVKSLREGHASLEEAYAKIEADEVWLLAAEIPEYKHGNLQNHTPKRKRKLLMRRSEINKFAAQASIKGFTLVPLRMYFKDGLAKVEIAIGKGKQTYDKRQSLKTAEANREMDRAIARQSRR